jgi:hypothetical protein
MIPKPKSKTKKRKQLKRQPAQKSKLNALKRKSDSKCLSRKTLVNKSVKNKVEIVSFRPVPKPGTRNGIKMVSHKQSEREKNLQKLNHYLKTNRAGGVCEICGSSQNLQGAHVIERSVGGKDIAGNIIIACGGIGGCHDHARYTHGLPISPADALIIVYKRNLEKGISNFLTGADVPNGIEIW